MKNFGILKDKEIDWTDELKLGKELLKTHLFEEKISATGTVGLFFSGCRFSAYAAVA